MVFADLTQIYWSCLPSELELVIARISLDIQILASFAGDNEIKYKKSTVFFQGIRAFISLLDFGTLTPMIVNGVVLPVVNEVRNLGVIMSLSLYWKSHVLSISGMVYFSLHKLKFHRSFFRLACLCTHGLSLPNV